MFGGWRTGKRVRSWGARGAGGSLTTGCRMRGLLRMNTKSSTPSRTHLILFAKEKERRVRQLRLQRLVSGIQWRMTYLYFAYQMIRQGLVLVLRVLRIGTDQLMS